MSIADLLRATGAEFDTAEHRLQAYSYDASNYRVRPRAVVFPRTVGEIRGVLRACSDAGVPVTVRGGGTSMAGNAVGEGVVVDLSRRLQTIGEIEFGIEPGARTPTAGRETPSVWVDAGVVMGELRSRIEAESGGAWTFAPDPSSVTRATIGGAIGNDACGNHSVAYGRTSHHVHEVELLTADGAYLVAGRGSLRAVDAADTRSVARAAEITDALRRLAADNLAELRTELQTIPRQVSGYHLGHLLPENGFDVARSLAGSEGTLAIVVRARVGLVPKPGPTALVCVGYDTTVDSARDVMTMLEFAPSAIEGLDSSIVDIMRHRRGAASVASLPEGEAYVIVEFSADTIEAAAARCEALVARLRGGEGGLPGVMRDHMIVTDPAARAQLWKVREDGAGLSSKRIDGVQTWPGWEDAAVAPEKLADYLADLLPVIERHGYTASMYGHFGAGCVHMRVDFELRTEAGRRTFDAFMREAAEVVVRHGGSLSGEHGDGRARGELLGLMYSARMLELFAEAKRIWDPAGALNPGIIVAPAPLAADLALAGLPAPDGAGGSRPVLRRGAGAEAGAGTETGPGAQAGASRPGSRRSAAVASPPRPGGRTELGTFVGNAHACIGVGRCRSATGGFMCPSYRATRDEKDSTRGRARVLQELARGRGTSAGGWAEPAVREALDLCLSCKACSTDCPTGVDMAEAKSELIHDHYRGKLRPFTHYTIGWLPRWLPLITRVSGLANLAARLRPLRRIGDRLGISARRELPAFTAHRELTRRIAEADFAPTDDADVLIFADSFTKAFRPEVIPAAARVLREAGARGLVGAGAGAGAGSSVGADSGSAGAEAGAVTGTAVEAAGSRASATVGCTADACCGLTWISTGQRDAAAKRLARLVDALDDGTERDIVVLEPSCAAAIRDDGPKLVGTAAAHRVAARVRSFGAAVDEALERGWKPTAPPPRRAVVQTHCHEHAVFGPQVQRRALGRWGVAEVAESSSCCGVAGNFGFESEHFDVSMQVAEHSIVPALAQGGDDALVLADGFSCTMQIGQLGAGASHLALALDPGADSQARPACPG